MSIDQYLNLSLSDLLSMNWFEIAELLVPPIATYLIIKVLWFTHDDENIAAAGIFIVLWGLIGFEVVTQETFGLEKEEISFSQYTCEDARKRAVGMSGSTFLGAKMEIISAKDATEISRSENRLNCQMRTRWSNNTEVLSKVSIENEDDGQMIISVETIDQ